MARSKERNCKSNFKKIREKSSFASRQISFPFKLDLGVCVCVRERNKKIIIRNKKKSALPSNVAARSLVDIWRKLHATRNAPMSTKTTRNTMKREKGIERIGKHIFLKSSEGETYTTLACYERDVKKRASITLAVFAEEFHIIQHCTIVDFIIYIYKCRSMEGKKNNGGCFVCEGDAALNEMLFHQWNTTKKTEIKLFLNQTCPFWIPSIKLVWLQG